MATSKVELDYDNLAVAQTAALTLPGAGTITFTGDVPTNVPNSMIKVEWTYTVGADDYVFLASYDEMNDAYAATQLVENAMGILGVALTTDAALTAAAALTDVDEQWEAIIAIPVLAHRAHARQAGE